MSGTHSLFGPSKASMWSRCLGALAAGRGIKEEPSEFAAEGTAYHEVSAKCLDSGAAAVSLVGETLKADGFSFVIDDDNADYAQVYVDAIRRLPGKLMVEVRLDISPILKIEGQGGTGDAVLLDHGSATIRVHDLKFGRGEVVYAHTPHISEEWTGANEQLMLYGAAAMYQFKDECNWQFVEIGIHQPRLGHMDVHTYTRTDVLKFVKHIRERALLAKAVYDKPVVELADLTPGEKQCRWCPVRNKCPARTNEMLALFPTTPRTPEKIMFLTDDELAKARDRVDEIAVWCNDVKSEALQRALAGRKLPGWILVDGRKGNRKFDDELIAEAKLAVLGEDAYQPKKIITPATAEKLMKKKHAAVWESLQLNISQSEGSPTLTREGDPRHERATRAVEFGLVQPEFT